MCFYFGILFTVKVLIKVKELKLLPYIISFAIGFPVPDETSARLVQVLAALGALEAGCVPLQVGRDPQDVLVVDLAPTSHTHRESGLLCTKSRAQ